jgi:hypothetical protein
MLSFGSEYLILPPVRKKLKITDSYSKKYLFFYMGAELGL